jgi:hypothetical protein
MERLPAGGGAGAVKALIDALGGDDVTARDAAARGLAKAPEAVLPLTRALLAATDEQVARRYAGALRAHRGHVSAARSTSWCRGARPPRAPQQGQGRRRRDLARARAHRADRRLAPAKHVELLFEYARRLRKAASRARRSPRSSRCCAPAPISTPRSTTTAVLPGGARAQGRRQRDPARVARRRSGAGAVRSPGRHRATRWPRSWPRTRTSRTRRSTASASGCSSRPRRSGAQLLAGIVDKGQLKAPSC